MPFCKREGFESAASKQDTFQDNEDVFYCEVTNEIFRYYEDYFRHVMLINSTVWQCEATGRENLTYVEALKSERTARKKMFKESLRAPVMLAIDHAKQSSLNTLSAIIAKFLRKRYFINEEVQACNKSTTYNVYTVVGIQLPGNGAVSPQTVYEETEKLLYKLRRVGNNATEVTVPFENIRRQRAEFTTENLQIFIKKNVTRVEGILRPRPESYKKYVSDKHISFSSIFIGKMPHFTPAKIKKQTTMNNFLTKNGGADKPKLSAKKILEMEKEKEKKLLEIERIKAEKLLEKEREKAEMILKKEKERAEKRANLMARIEKECNALLNKTDDLERSDQRLLPIYTPISTYLPIKLFGDALMLREFMHSFVGMLSSTQLFRGNITFYEMTRALSLREVAGPLADIFQVLLNTIFDLQKEEEEECPVYYLKMHKDVKAKEIYTAMSLATNSHYFVRRHYAAGINELPVDAFTLSEVLRLHLLSSGAIVKDRAEKWRNMYRNGYMSIEDPGLELRMQFPHILRALRMYTIYQLPFLDIMRVLRCLMAQILTYSSTLSLMDERMEEIAKVSTTLKSVMAAENMRLQNVQAQKRALNNEYIQECLPKDVKDNPKKKQELEGKLNKKIAKLLAQSDREQQKYESEVFKLHSSMFNHIVFLGMDRAYRKYYVLESLPGILVEHSADCMDTCLSNPPKNEMSAELSVKLDSLPKNRKELRNYLLKMYTEEEKKAALLEKANKKKINQENKENQEIVTNGLAASPAPSVELNNKDKPLTNGTTELPPANAAPHTTPTQYELYMCTGNRHNCIVHDERSKDRQLWAFIYKKKDVEDLIESLNPLGERESELRSKLTVMRELILNHVKKCPTHMLSVDKNQTHKFKNQMMSDTYSKYNNSNYGFPEASDLNVVMRSVLVDRILLFENEIYTGDLGRLKVEDRQKWRDDICKNNYEPQCKLQWGPFGKTTLTDGPTSTVTEADDEEMDDDMDGDIETPYMNKNTKKPYRDPGESLGRTMEIDSEDSEEDEVCLYESPGLREEVLQLASALLQVEQAIEKRFITEPFGAPLEKMKDKEALDRRIKIGIHQLKQWEISLMECTSYSEVFLHLNVLHDAIVWARSTNKSSCRVCRRGSDPEQMLLCDECNGGTHMFCMKPPMKTVPEGNWYCRQCVERLNLQNKDDNVKKQQRSERRRVSGRYGLRANDIEQILEAEDNEEESENGIKEETNENGTVGSKDENEGEDEDDDDEAIEDFGSEIEEADDGDDDSQSLKSQKIEMNGDSDEDEDALICNICSYDGSEIICARCKNSFHLECIKIKRAPRYLFLCTHCKSNDDRRKRKSKDNDDYVDEDDSSESQAPRSKRLRPQRLSLRNSLHADGTEDKATSSKNLRRSHRRTGDNLPLDNSTLHRLLEDIMKHEQAWPFLRPVLQSEVPDYYKIIKYPMDFAKVKSKLNMGNYQLNEEVMSDIQLIFKNCDKYNVKGNEIYEAGCALEKFVFGRCKDLNLPFKRSDMSE